MLSEKTLDMENLSAEVIQMKTAVEIISIILGFLVIGFVVYKFIQVKNIHVQAFFMRYFNRQDGLYQMSNFNDSSTAVTMLDDQGQGTNEEISAQAEHPEDDDDANSQAIDENEFTTPRREEPTNEVNIKGNYIVLLISFYKCYYTGRMINQCTV